MGQALNGLSMIPGEALLAGAAKGGKAVVRGVNGIEKFASKANNTEPLFKGLGKLKQKIKNRYGITIDDSAKAEKALSEANNRADYDPVTKLMQFRRRPTEVDVFEELIHLRQNRLNGFKRITPGEMMQMEMDAQKELIKIGERRGWSNETINGFRKRWQEEAVRLGQLKARGGF